MNPDAAFLVDSFDKINAHSFDGDDNARRQVLDSARAMVRRLEDSVESLWEMSTNYVFMYTSLKVALDRDVFNKLSDDDERPKSTAELSGDGDPYIVKKYLRHLASMNVIAQPGPDHWAHTRLTRDLRNPEITSLVEVAEFLWYRLALATPAWLIKNGYRQPRDGSDCAWMDIGSVPFFDAIKDAPEKQTSFTNLMRGYRSQAPPWTDLFPTETLVATAAPEGPILVDQGGSSGHDVKKFLAKHPEAAGRLVFSDQAHVIKEALPQVPPGITAMAHDIFDIQPVEGARAYYMHSILHDWPDDVCRDILLKLKPAFKPGYSSLLVVDMVIPPTGATRYQTSQDIVMSNALAAKERTEEDWTNLLASAGFKIVKVHSIAASEEAVIEAVLAD